MASVNMSQVQFWQPPSNPISSKQRIASLHTSKNGTSGSTTRPHNRSILLDHSGGGRDIYQAKSVVTKAQLQRDDSAFQQDDDAVEAQGHDNALLNCGNETDDDFPTIDELLAQTSRKKISTKEDQNSKDTHQYLEVPAIIPNESHLGSENSRLDGTSDKQGTRDRPVVLEDGGLAELESSSQGTFVYPPRHETWWDIEEGCFVDEDSHPLPLLEQNNLASPYAQPQSERETQPGFGSQERLPPTPASSSSHSRHHSVEPLHPQIDQHDQSRASNVRSNSLDCDSIFVSQSSEEGRKVHQKEIAAEQSGDGEPIPDEQRKKRPCPTTSENDESDQYSKDGNINFCTNDNGLKNNQDSRPTKRRKQIPQTPNSLPTPATSVPAADYHEWPFQGFLKRTKIDTLTLYNLEFQLPHALEHCSLPISVDAPGDSLDQENVTAATTFPSATACSKASPAIKVDFTAPDEQWGIRKITSQKMIGRQKHFLVEWQATWMPDSELAGAEKLITAFLANTERIQSVEPKKRRGRPRKQQ